MAIRYDKEFNKEISRVVKNFNAKISRLEGMSRVLAPDYIKVSELKSQFDRRSDLKRKLKEMKLFSIKGIEEDVQIGEWKTTKYEALLEKRRAAVTKSNLTRQIKQAEKSARLKDSMFISNLKKRREILNLPIKSLSKSMFKTRQNIINKDYNYAKRKETFYNNLFQMIYKSAFVAGIDHKIINKVLQQLEKMTPAQISDLMYSNSAFNAFILKYKALDRFGENNFFQVENSIQNLLDSLNQAQNFYS